MQTLTKIGKIQNTHGVKGELVISHLLKNNNELKTWKAFLIELHKDSFIPFFIKEYRVTAPQEILCLLEEIKNPEDAKEIIGCNVYASPLVQVNQLIKNEWDELIGYFIRDTNEGAIGQIQNISKGVGQQFFEVQMGNKNLLIPIQETWFSNVNNTTKTITINLPEGFLEIFGA